jgi:hypothetical protein
VVSGQPANTVEIRYTLVGDVNLDGSVNITDVNTLVPHYNSSGDWTGGDFNYDGKVNITDANALVPNYNTSLPAGVGAVAAATLASSASASAATASAVAGTANEVQVASVAASDLVVTPSQDLISDPGKLHGKSKRRRG